jgi:hypothetical protein
MRSFLARNRRTLQFPFGIGGDTIFLAQMEGLFAYQPVPIKLFLVHEKGKKR